MRSFGTLQGHANQALYQSRAWGAGLSAAAADTAERHLPLHRFRRYRRTGMRHGGPARHSHVGAAQKKALPMAAQSMQVTASSA